MKKIIISLLWLLSINVSVNSQIMRVQIQQKLTTVGLPSYGDRVNQLKKFYATRDYQAAWLMASSISNLPALFELFKTAAINGLDEKDYQYDFINKYQSNKLLLGNIEDSANADIAFTDAALHFLNDLEYGNIKPALRYEGLTSPIDDVAITSQLSSALEIGTVSQLPGQLHESMPEINLIRRMIAHLNSVLADAGYRDELITGRQVNGKNKPLLKKLYAFGVLDSIDEVNDSTVLNSLRHLQRNFNLLADGVLRNTTLQSLNQPLSVRLRQLKTAINYYRWLSGISSREPLIVVNIPAAYLKVHGPEGVILEMKMVVGKPSTPTPTLSSRISEVILYPYWMVPFSIATKELLPHIKVSPGFLAENNFQVLSSAGKILDPYKIDWSGVSASNFPYILRQSTGCDNSLGLIKLNFYSPFGVYLHDTPAKLAFMSNRRYYSHGCMRMENPMALGHLILRDNPAAIDTLTEKGCIQHQSPLVVPADVKMAVVVWYNIVQPDSLGNIIFYEDIYKKWK